VETPDRTKNMEISGTDGLDEFTTETVSSSENASSSSELISVVRAETSSDTVTPPHLSRMDAVRSRRAKSSAASRFRRRAAILSQRARESGRSMAGYAPAVLAWLARPRGWLSYGAAQGASAVWRLGVAVRRVPAAVGRAVLAWRTALGDRRASRREPTGTLNTLESEGSFIAAALAIAVVSYGGLLLVSWKHPDTRVSDASLARRAAVVETGPVRAVALPTEPQAIPPTPAVTPAGSPALDDQPLPRQRMSQAALTAVWNRSDTRSLQGALNNVRQQTLALHHCGMKMTGTDRAVARCDDSSHVTYTIDFRRTAGHWVIQRVSSR